HARVGLDLLHEALAHDHRIDLGREERGRERLGCAAARDVVPGLQTGGRHFEHRRNRDQHQRTHALRMGEREGDRDGPAEGAADEHERSQRQRIGEGRRAAQVRVEIGKPFGAAGTAVAGKIERHARVLALEVRQLAMPGVGVGPGAMQKQQQLAAVERRHYCGERRRTGVKKVDGDAVDADILGEHTRWSRLKRPAPSCQADRDRITGYAADPYTYSAKRYTYSYTCAVHEPVAYA